jgi:hypothetical protein
LIRIEPTAADRTKTIRTSTTAPAAINKTARTLILYTEERTVALRSTLNKSRMTLRSSSNLRTSVDSTLISVILTVASTKPTDSMLLSMRESQALKTTWVMPLRF